jgi:putative addiction module component (TIGR02574 family)
MGSPLPVPPPGFDELNVDEQIDYVQALWDRIAANSDRVPVPDWHHEIIDERLRDLDAHPDAGRPWDEVKADLLRKTHGST